MSPEGVRIVTVQSSSNAPTRFSYTLDAEVVPILEADGSVTLTSQREVNISGISDPVTVTATVGTIAPAWAIDANGSAVPTRYEVDCAALSRP